jgi:hypothetical protein
MPPRLVCRSSQTSQTPSGESRTHSATHSLGITNKDNIKLECWLYDDIPSTSSPFKEGNIYNSDIAAWFRGPCPLSSPGRKLPSVGLRLICREHEFSIAESFDDRTLRDIHDVMGIPSTHTYLMTHGAGQCGKYMVGPYQPCKLYRLRSVIIGGTDIPSIHIPSLEQQQHNLRCTKTRFRNQHYHRVHPSWSSCFYGFC